MNQTTVYNTKADSPKSDGQETEGLVSSGKPTRKPSGKPSGKITPLMKQFNAFKERYPDKIVFFRMGDFYEMFGEDAIKAAPILGITLTSRGGAGSDSIALAGVPYHAADKYLSRLVLAGEKVVIVEQVEDPKEAKGIVKRDVVEILTPATASFENDTDTGAPTYLSAICAGGNGAKGVFGLAYLDVSTAEFRVFDADVHQVAERYGALAPRETLFPENKNPDLDYIIDSAHSPKGQFATDSYQFEQQVAIGELKRFFKVNSLAGFGLDESAPSIGAAGAILRYLAENHRTTLNHITSISRVSADSFMRLDYSSARNLELVESLTGDDKEATLLGAVNLTRTAAGERRLRRNLLAPFSKLEEVGKRQKAVTECLQNSTLRESLRESLRVLPDLPRLVGRLGVKRISPRQTLALASGLTQGCAIAESLKTAKSELLRVSSEKFPQRVMGVAESVATRLVESPPLLSSGGGIFRKGASEELDALKFSIADAKSYMSGLQASEREKTGISSLRLGFNKVFGYYLEVTHLHRDKIPERFIRKQTLVSAERYITEEMKVHESVILAAEEKIFKLERELFDELLEELTEHIVDMQLAGEILAEIDVVSALAELAVERDYVCPTLTADNEIQITDGRHPVIENILPKGTFVPNDTFLSAQDTRVMILTGPNMAGKSTFLRQLGHIVVLAQIGSYVPAKAATIGICDRIFTRVGAVDNLSRGQSTFMVEMLETANILNNATANSLVLLDEVGRGTSTFDGLSIAWALAEDLHNRIGARTIFATHYHELTALAEQLDAVKNYQVAVKRWQGEVIFLHKIIPGGCDDSYGIEVARLAGMPKQVLARAAEILRGLEAGKSSSSFEAVKAKERPAQTSLFDIAAPSEVERRLTETNIESLTPLQALVLLSELKELLPDE